jgi:hypothetical protein
VALLALGCCAAALAACGSSSNVSDTGSSIYSKALKYSDCMRSHGLSKFPDPSPSGGFSISPVGDGTVTPAFVSAQKACVNLEPGGSPPRVTGRQQQQMVAKAQCIRGHGVPTFDDPTFAPGGLGVNDNLPPNWNIYAPAVIKAKKACAHVGIAIPGAGVA